MLTNDDACSLCGAVMDIIIAVVTAFLVLALVLNLVLVLVLAGFCCCRWYYLD